MTPNHIAQVIAFRDKRTLRRQRIPAENENPGRGFVIALLLSIPAWAAIIWIAVRVF